MPSPGPLRLGIAGTEIRWTDAEGVVYQMEGTLEASASETPRMVRVGSDRLWYSDEHGDRRSVPGQAVPASASAPSEERRVGLASGALYWRGTDGTLYRASPTPEEVAESEGVGAAITVELDLGEPPLTGIELEVEVAAGLTDAAEVDEDWQEITQDPGPIATTPDVEEMLLDWQEVDHAQEYEVYRSTDTQKVEPDAGDLVQTTADLQWTDTGLDPDTEYKWWVRAINPEHTGPYADVVDSTDEDVPDEPIEDFAAQLQDIAPADVEVVWIHNPGVDSTVDNDGLDIEQAATPDFDDFTVRTVASGYDASQESVMDSEQDINWSTNDEAWYRWAPAGTSDWSDPVQAS